MKRSGVYTIENTINGHRYIGSAKGFDCRWAKHQRDLRGKRHHCRHLQHAYNKYGEGAFRFEVLEEIEPEFVVGMEQWWMNMLRPEYNVCPVAGSALGVRRSEETRRKVSAAKKGIKLGPRSVEAVRRTAESNTGKRRSEEAKGRMRVAAKGRKRPPPASAQTRAKMRAAMVGNTYALGHKHDTSEETRRKIGQASGLARKGKPLSEEHRHAIGAANKGRVRSEETKRSMQASWTEERRRKNGERMTGNTHALGNRSALGHAVSEEARRKISEAHKGRSLSEEHRQKIGEANMGRVVSEETRRRIGEAQTGRVFSEDHKRKLKEAWIVRRSKRPDA